MKTDRLISIVRSLLYRTESYQEQLRLTSLLVLLQKDYIHELEKTLAPTNRRNVS